MRGGKNSTDVEEDRNVLMRLYDFILSWKINGWWLVLFLLAEAILSFVVVKKIPYTEIDWRAYMEEVEGYLSGERDYTKIQGCTGPLVYPAGFIYIFSWLRTVTDGGMNILKAQYIFVGVYLCQQWLTLWAYWRSSNNSDDEDAASGNTKGSSRKQGIPAVFCGLLLLSKRVHSIYMLRMFNDCIAVLLGFVALLHFTSDWALPQRSQTVAKKSLLVWVVGSIFYSLAVSVKMNMLLFAPGLTLVYLMNLGWVHTVLCIGMCGVVQLVVGLEFLSTYPVSYLTKAFELSRVFTFKWSVNFQFLPEDVFLSKQLSLLLLALTAAGYLLFAVRWVSQLYKGINEATKSEGLTKSISIVALPRATSAKFVFFTIFTSNFIGIVFARSLHYQFYSWYFHSLPLLMFYTALPLPVIAVLMAGIEVCFNVFPATWWSSALLQCCHVIILVFLYFSDVPLLEGKRLGKLLSSRNKEQ